MILNGFKDPFALKSKGLIRGFKTIPKTKFPENVLRNYTGCLDDACFVALLNTIL